MVRTSERVRRPEPRQARSRATQERLLDVGEELFAARGFDGASIMELARAAGCATGVFYQRFADKGDLFAAVQDRFVERATVELATLAAAFDGRSADFEGLLSDASERLVAWFRGNQAILRCFLHYGITHPEAAGRLNAINQQFNRAACDLVAGFDPATDTDQFGFALQAAVATLVHALLHDPGPVALDDPHLADHIHHLLTAGRQPTQRHRPPARTRKAKAR